MGQAKLLFVDDEDELISALVERLELRGIDATGVTSGDEALERLREEHFDVVVIDVKMPGIGGLEVLRTISRRYPDVKVILMTGHGSTEDSEIGRRLGAVAYLQKPVDLEDLLATVRQASSSMETQESNAG
ncbi:MAG: response regulator [Acidobacteriota bacterium]|nr:response regulator [Acidobacteriota bacterium]